MARSVERGVEAVVVAVVIAMLAGQVLGQPVLLSYVTSESMEPTIEAGDGFVSVPAAVTGPPSSGDVVVYEAETLNGGGLTTHRVVRETDRGYITRGDGNPFTDQSAGEPPVSERQVVAVGLQIGGKLVVVPDLGTAVTTVSDTTDSLTHRIATGAGIDPDQIWIMLSVAGLVVLLASRTDGTGRTPTTDRSHSRRRGGTVGPRELVLGVGLVVVVAATASMLLPFGPTEYTVVSAESDVPGPAVIPAGESETTTYRVPGGEVVPTLVRVAPASEGVSVSPERRVVPAGGAANVSVSLSAPPELGRYDRLVTEHRYPLVFPLSVIGPLARFHPLAPVFLIDACVATPFVVVARLFGGRTPTRSRSASGAVTGFERLLRRFR